MIAFLISAISGILFAFELGTGFLTGRILDSDILILFFITFAPILYTQLRNDWHQYVTLGLRSISLPITRKKRGQLMLKLSQKYISITLIISLVYLFLFLVIGNTTGTYYTLICILGILSLSSILSISSSL